VYNRTNRKDEEQLNGESWWNCMYRAEEAHWRVIEDEKYFY
jgi:hypothetical protein